MTIVRTTCALVAVVVAGATVSAGAGSASRVPRVVFVTVSGQGHITSKPRGISCPGTCRAFFPKDSRVQLVARPAAGWRLAAWSGSFCTGGAATCGFNLTTSHECSNGLCKVGSFGVRARFVAAS